MACAYSSQSRGGEKRDEYSYNGRVAPTPVQLFGRMVGTVLSSLHYSSTMYNQMLVLLTEIHTIYRYKLNCTSRQDDERVFG